MPKPINSKKKAVPVKSQQAITLFFKNANSSNGQLAVTKAVIHKSEEKSMSLKRKASPLKSTHNHESASSIKKHKIDSDNVVLRRSPRKKDCIDIPEDEVEDKRNRPILSPVNNTQSHKNYTPKKLQYDMQKKVIEMNGVPNKTNGIGASPMRRSPRLANLKKDVNISPKRVTTPNKVSPNKAKVALNFDNDSDDFTSSPKKALILNKVITKKIIAPKDMPNKVVAANNSSLNKALNLDDDIAFEVFNDAFTSPKKVTPTKVLSPEKSPQALNFGNEFDDDFDIGDFDEGCKDDLDISVMQRCKIVSISQTATSTQLRLESGTGKQATCTVEGVWRDTPLSVGDVISVIASQNLVSNTQGLLVLNPDHLMSSTSVVGGVYCRRKAILQDRFKGIDCANDAMTIGTLVHELVQKALTENISDPKALRKVAENLLKDSLHMLYDAGLSMDFAMTSISNYIPSLVEFMQLYVLKKSKNLNSQKDRWNGHIEEILDIEENLCCPQLGVKGKIDATLQVTIYEKQGKKSAIVPLELKTGRGSGSAEHRGQVVLYGMMLATLRNEDPATKPDIRGLLLYLKEKADVREVSCGYPERRDLLMLRNQLVHHLTDTTFNPDDITDIEDLTHILRQRLPEPVYNERACTTCPYLTLCSLYLWNTEGHQVTSSHPLSKLKDNAIGHLSPSHTKYFLHWASLVKLEEKGQKTSARLSALWTETPEKRMQRGVCFCNATLELSESKGDRFWHTFRIQLSNGIDTDKRGPQPGEFSIVSIDNRPWIAAGIITALVDEKLHMLLERDLARRYSKSTRYHIDSYESYGSTVQNLTNLGVIMDDNDRANKLRRLIIDKEVPEFHLKLPREVGRLGVKLMKGLNTEQQRAVLKAIMAKDYMLLQGLPGTGKTQTISVLIQMLVALKQRVLVTAHTHSAVDTVLMRLPKSMFLRLGSSLRVSPCLLANCEDTIMADASTPEELAKIYDGMAVVGVTCLGSSHALLAKTVFDVCIVDEATQVLQSTVLRPLLSAHRFIMVGDPEQLPPVIQSRHARKLGMEESVFTRLINTGGTETLKLQYRMNGSLTELANKVAYGGKLKCATDRVKQATVNVNIELIKSEISKYPWLDNACNPGHSAVFLDTGRVEASSTKSLANKVEAHIVLVVLQALIKGGVKPSDIGVMAPFRDQVTLLRHAAARLSADPPEVNTVDQFQGKDKSVIVYSCTRSDDEERKVTESEVLNDQRRLAVAVTRAKHKLIAIGDSKTLRKYAPFERLLDACAQLVTCSDHRTQLNKDFNNFIE